MMDAVVPIVIPAGLSRDTYIAMAAILSGGLVVVLIWMLMAWLSDMINRNKR